MRVAFVYLNNERNVGRGPGFVVASILRAGHEAAFFDTYFASPEDVAARVAAGRFDVLMVSSMTMLFPAAVRLIRLVKARCGIPVLVGGVHATIVGGKLLEEHPEIDYLCVGEGESMAVDFLARLGTPALAATENLVWRRDGQVVANPLRPAEDLARLPPFPWHLFSRDAIVLPGNGFLYVNATRGCPFHCSYCANGIYLKHYGKGYLRFRPIDEVVRELVALRRAYRPKLFYFGDEMILSDPDAAAHLFRALREEVGVPWGCMARVEAMTSEIVDLMAESGCQYVAMGVECGDEAFRRRSLWRTMSNDQIARAFARARARGIFTTSFNMIGYPFENDPALTEATVEFNLRIRPDYAQVSVFYPFPGTGLYDHCLRDDLIDPAKLARTTDYFKDSVLRGMSLRGRLKEIHERLNPHGFRFTVRPCPPASAAKRPAARGRSVLMLAMGEGQAGDGLLAEARALCGAGYEVRVVAGLEAAEETHRIADGVAIHEFSQTCEGRSPRHPALARLLGYVPTSHMGLRTFFARLFWFGERLVLRRRALAAFAEAKLAPLASDVVHVCGAEGLDLGVRLARQWQAALVCEGPDGAAGPPVPGFDGPYLALGRRPASAELVAAYATLDRQWFRGEVATVRGEGSNRLCMF